MGKRKLPPAILRIERMSDGGEWRDSAPLVDDFTGEVIERAVMPSKAKGPLESADSIQMRGHRLKVEASRLILQRAGMIAPDSVPVEKKPVRLVVRYRRSAQRRI